MTTPALVKTWQFGNINKVILAQGSLNTTMALLMWTIKQCFITQPSQPWDVPLSSNAGGTPGLPVGGAGAGDRWTTVADLQVANPGTVGRHTWIVLRQTGVSANASICFDLNNSNNFSVLSVIFSPAAGFTGGSVTARPTATDEVVVVNTGAWASAVDANHVIQQIQSTDGKSTRLCVWRAGTNMCTWLSFDVPLNAPSGWSNPCIMTFAAATSGIATTYSSLTGTGIGWGRGPTATMNVGLTCEGVNGSSIMPALAGIGTNVSVFDSTWPFFPAGAYSTVALNQSYLGVVPDYYWKPSSVNDADTFPVNLSARDWVAFGPTIWPWTGGSDVPLIA